MAGVGRVRPQRELAQRPAHLARHGGHRRVEHVADAADRHRAGMERRQPRLVDAGAGLPELGPDLGLLGEVAAVRVVEVVVVGRDGEIGPRVGLDGRPQRLDVDTQLAGARAPPGRRCWPRSAGNRPPAGSGPGRTCRGPGWSWPGGRAAARGFWRPSRASRSARRTSRHGRGRPGTSGPAGRSARSPAAGPASAHRPSWRWSDPWCGRASRRPRRGWLRIFWWMSVSEEAL